MKKIITVIGARPQFIKAAPVSKILRQFFKEAYIHTGQHYDSNMSDIFFEELNIPKPEYHLGIGSASHGKQTGEMLKLIEEIYLKENPDAVIVYGDTNSTLAGALAASKMNIPIFHIEAGLRSFNKYMPEEQNRVITDHLSSLLLCPTETAVNNLKKEGITKGVFNVGDVMFDSILQNIEVSEKKHENINTILNSLKLLSSNWINTITKKGYYLATIHRAENTNQIDKIKDILKLLNSLDKPVIFPVHPRIREMVIAITAKENTKGNLYITNPLSYLETLWLTKYASKVITDSGGLQKEAFFLQTPCITLREETEWVETTKSGWNVLVGLDNVKIMNAISIGNDPNLPITNYFGDGKSAKKIVDTIEKFFQSNDELEK